MSVSDSYSHRDLQNYKIENRCRWCGNTFKKVSLPGLEPYLCSTLGCAERQLKHAIWVSNKYTKGKNHCVYVPLPIGVDMIECNAPNVLSGGSAGSSKSYGLRWLGHYFGLKQPNYRILLLREKLTELKTTHVQEGLEFEEDILSATLNKTDLYFRYPNGSIMQLGHMENFTQYLSTQYDLLLADEIVTLPEREMLLVMSRIGRRPGFGGGVRAGSNPGGREAAWVKHRWIDKDVSPDEDPVYRPEDWIYIPGTVKDNPYIDPMYPMRLLSLPQELREAYLFGNWDIFVGQFFSEWRNRTVVENGECKLMIDATTNKPFKYSHVYPHVEYPESYLRICSIDWGYVKPGWAGWFVMLPDGHAYLEEEYVFQRTQAPDVAKEIARRTRSRGLLRTRYVGDYEMWGPNADSGESTAETFARFGVSMQQADKERRNGWVRFRSWLRAAPDGKPWLMSSERNKYFNRTIPAQVSDETDPEDIDHKSNTDHAADGGRYFATSRPHPEVSARIQVYGPNTVGSLKELIAKRNRSIIDSRG